MIWPELCGQLLQSSAHHIVIIVTPGVAGNPAVAGFIYFCGSRLGAVVEFRDAEDGARTRENQLGIGANLRAAIGEVAHGACHSAIYPVEIAAAVIGQRLGGCNAGKLKATVLGQELDLSRRHDSIILNAPCGDFRVH